MHVFRIYRRFCERLSKKLKGMENRKIKHKIGGRDFSEDQVSVWSPGLGPHTCSRAALGSEDDADLRRQARERRTRPLLGTHQLVCPRPTGFLGTHTFLC